MFKIKTTFWFIIIVFKKKKNICIIVTSLFPFYLSYFFPPERPPSKGVRLLINDIKPTFYTINVNFNSPNPTFST